MMDHEGRKGRNVSSGEVIDLRHYFQPKSMQQYSPQRVFKQHVQTSALEERVAKAMGVPLEAHGTHKR